MVLADLNKNIFGAFYLWKAALKRFCFDLFSYGYLIRKIKMRKLVNFFYTKAIVPTGEGSQRWLYGPFEWYVRKFSQSMPLPKYIEIETTTICNKRCFICEYIYWPQGDQVKRHMRLEEFKRIIGQFPSLRWINMTGEGSAFLNPDYFLMLKHLSEKFSTSIWLVDHLADIRFDKLRSDVLPYVDGIYVSMDGATKKTYESIKIGCNFDNVVNNLRLIIEYKKKNKTPFPHLSFRYIILKENIHEMPLFLDLLNSLASPRQWGGSASYVEFTGLLYFPEVESHYVKEIPSDVINELLKRKKGIGFFFSHPEESRNPPIEQCTAWMEPYIMMPGYVLPCCSVLMSNRRPFLRQYSFGNVFKEDFKDIWSGEYYKQFRKVITDPALPVPKICVGCRAFRTKERARSKGVWDIHAGKVA
ncbi:MAG: SPASM domain-containing protein [Candidatus Omnitrophica bacterium]|nr:SPASM domain-containing protein [Candidatus Omnitrophota bacterium]